MTLYQDIQNTCQSVISQVLGDEFQGVDPLLKRTADAKFGDYQSNVCMSLAKKLGQNPRELAGKLLEKFQDNSLFSKVEVAGPGFINFHLSPDALVSEMVKMSSDERLGIPLACPQERYAVDFSSPNLAKEMHVGHLRTTITGEVLCRLFEFFGHPVERINHVGDWGTPFGMLMQYLYEKHPEVIKDPDGFSVGDLQSFYRKAKELFDSDEAFNEKARQRVVDLQSGDEVARKLWKAFVTESLRHCHEIYQLLDVKLKDQGESFYNDHLPGVIQSLKEVGLAKEDDGAICVFMDGFKNRDGDPLPMIVQKKDGGFNYSTTDLAALQYRVNELGAKNLVYITDKRQAQHFAMIFEVGRKMNWAPESVHLQHVGYGMVLGSDRKPFKTRDGSTIRLKDLIAESVAKAKEKVMSSREQDIKSGQMSEEQASEIADHVGVAAIKYYDLSHALSSDYVFHWDQVLSPEGNTGPYMLYAYARLQSIARKAGVDFKGYQTDTFVLSHSSEVHLAKTISRAGDVIQNAVTDLKPHYLTEYLFELAKAFSVFYDKKSGVSVLDAESEELKKSRLGLCALTSRALKCLLTLLSIQTVDVM
jgi:arginyl-tRNA synthetase